jgi:hypothetical protein
MPRDVLKQIGDEYKIVFSGRRKVLAGQRGNKTDSLDTPSCTGSCQKYARQAALGIINGLTENAYVEYMHDEYPPGRRRRCRCDGRRIRLYNIAHMGVF